MQAGNNFADFFSQSQVISFLVRYYKHTDVVMHILYTLETPMSLTSEEINSQPELWREELFAQLRRCCRPGAILTTYCAKGEVRRRLERSGFSVERLPGPPGKREVLRATAR